MTTGAVNVAVGSADRSRGGDGAVFLRGRKVTGVGRFAPSARRAAIRPGTRFPSVLHRLFGVDVDDVQSISAIASPVRCSASRASRPASARLGTIRTSLGVPRSDQHDVQGSKDSVGGRGRLHRRSIRERLRWPTSATTRQRRPFDWLSATLSFNAQDEDRRASRFARSIRRRDDVAVEAVATRCGRLTPRRAPRGGLWRRGLRRVASRPVATNQSRLGHTVRRGRSIRTDPLHDHRLVLCRTEFDLIRRRRPRSRGATGSASLASRCARTAPPIAPTPREPGVADSAQSYQDWTSAPA